MGARTAELLRLGASPLSSPAALGEFASGGSWKRHPHLQLINEYLLKVAAGRIKRLAISMPPQHGKPFALDTPVLTTDGWKVHGDLRPGDHVFAPDGRAVEVLRVTAHFLDQSFRLEFDDGATVIAGAHHEWVVETDRDLKRGGERVRRVERLETRDLLRGHHRRPPRIAIARFIDHPARQLPIDPYVLGVWLGDGNTRNAYITCGRQDIEHFRALGKCVEERDGHFRILVADLQRRLRLLGLIGAKRIPTEFLRASYAQRLSLLQGLMDTDGCCDPRGTCEFTTTCPAIAEGALELIRGLGLKPRVTEGRATLYGKDCGKKWRIFFNAARSFHAFRLPRKQQRMREKVRERARFRYLDTLEPVGLMAVSCIQVQGGLYLVGRELVATSNSELISHYFPAWYLLHWPQQKIILASYEAAFARMWGRKARDLVERYGTELAGVMVRRDSKAANLWLLEAGGYMATAGVRGPVSGKAGNGVIIDDSLKDAREAQSKIIKDGQEDWFDSVVKPRLAKEGWAIIVGTRWAKDDLIGRVTAKNAKGGDEWEVLNLPAIAEKRESYGMSWTRSVGDPLCEDLHPLKELQKAKASMRAYWWSAVYMGRPTVKGGKFFKRGWWKWAEPDDVPKLSRFARLVRYWDKAATEEGEGDDPDFTVGALIGELEIPIEGQPGEFDTEYWVLDVVRDQLSSAGVRKLMRSTAERDGEEVMIRVEQEPGSSGKDVAYEFYDVFAGFPYKPERVTGSKSLRAESFAGAVENGKVRLVKAAWNEAWLEEFDDFPNGGHDDQVDAGSGAYRTIHRPGPTVDYVS